MAKVIVTYGRSWQALAIVRSLGRKGIDVVVGEEAPFATCFFSKYCRSSFRHPSFVENPDGFLDRLEEVVIQQKPEDPNEPYVLIPVHKETWLVAKHRERFEPHIRMALSPYENLQLVHDKGRLAKLALELGITIPETRFFENIDDLYRAVPDLTFPQFVKVREGAAGVGIRKVDSPDELIKAFREFVEGYKLEPEEYPLVQAGVPGHDYCVTALFNQGEPIASMTYRNIRAFPRDTGAGSLRETVRLDEAEESAQRLLGHLNWHGIAELDYRKADDGPAYLIEVNPRFFGGLPQSVAANVDYPYLLFQIACGEAVQPVTEVDYTVRTESPVTGLLATLEEIANDPGRIQKLERLKSEIRSLGRRDIRKLDFRPFFEAFKDVVDTKDIKKTLQKKLEVHQGTINDVLQSDDPMPAMGLLYPLVLMLKHGKLSVGILTSEKEVGEARPRRTFKERLLHPTWGTLFLTGTVFGLCLFLRNWSATESNIGEWFALPQRLAEMVAGKVQDPSTLWGALQVTVYYALNFLFYYVIAALILGRRKPAQAPSDSLPKQTS